MKLATIAFAALSAAIAAAPAYAGGALVGNGSGTNTFTFNGVAYNALIGNGVAYNTWSNGVAVRGSAGMREVTCIIGGEPACEVAPVLEVRSVTLGNGTTLELR